MLEYPAAERRVAEGRPAVLYIHVAPAPGFVNTSLLVPPAGARPAWQPGVVPRGVRIELLKPPLPPPVLGEPGTNPPRDAVEDASSCVRTTFSPAPWLADVGRGVLSG